MASPKPVTVQRIGDLVRARLCARYPALATDADGPAQLAELLAFFRAIIEGAQDRAAGIAGLLRFARSSGDPGAPAELIAIYLAALDEAGIPVPATRDANIRAMQDMAEIMRRASDEATEAGHALAELDPISGLPDRSALHRRASALIEECRKHGKTLSVLCVSLQHDNRHLDLPGHASQEDLVRRIVRCLDSPPLRPKDVPGRTDGLEFIILLPDLRHPALANMGAEAVHRELVEPMVVGPDEISLSCAVGVATFPEHAESAAGLFQCARQAAREANHTSQRFVVYSGDALREEQAAAELTRDLREAIANNALNLYFQPQLDLHSGEVRSVEALVRWERRRGDWVNPEKIIEYAKDSALLSTLSRWVVREAAKQHDDWRRNQGLDIVIGVNLLTFAFLEADLPEVLRDELNAFLTPPQRILIEITESENIQPQDLKRSLAVLQRLKSLGFSISIDDFGTGHSSMKRLSELPLDELKIDKMFVADMMTVPKHAMIVSATIKMAHGMNLVVVAEGVEDEPTREALERMGCDRIQGYLLSRPLSAQACTDFLLARRAPVAVPGSTT